MDAIYVSVWDGGTEIRSKCKYDETNKIVSDIETVAVDGLDILDEEYIELADGTRLDDFFIEGDDPNHLTAEEIAELSKTLKKFK